MSTRRKLQTMAKALRQKNRGKLGGADVGWLSVSSLECGFLVDRTRLGTHSNPGDHYGCEGETREIVLRMAVISGCDAPPVLELAEHSFDEISAFVGPAVQGIGRPA